MNNEKLFFKERLKNVVPVTLLISFTCCLAGPISLYLSNTEEFWFSLIQMLPWVLSSFAVAFIILSTITSLVPDKWFFQCLSICFGIGIGFYLQGNFLVKDYGLLDGRSINWSEFTKWAVFDTLVWCVCILVPLIIWYFDKIVLRQLVRIVSYCLILVQSISLVVMFFVTPNVSGNNDYLLTTENFNIVSSNENVIVFLLDAFDTTYMDDLLENNPEYLEEFKDFVYYKNMAAIGAPTHIAMPVILTGYLYKDEVSYSDYISLAYNYTPLYKALNDGNYNVGIYTNSRFVDRTQSEYISNISYESPKIKSQRRLGIYISKLTAFRYMPHILKSHFEVYSGVFEELKMDGEQYESYGINDRAYELLQMPLEFEQNRNAFRLYHVMGAHPPYSINENAEIVGNEATTLEQQIKGCFYIICNYVDQLKAQGVYDNSTIFIMADHGDTGIQENPLFMVKYRGADNDFQISTAPVSYIDLLPTFMAIIGQDSSGYGRSIFDIAIDEDRQRWFYQDIHTSETRHIAEYTSNGTAWDHYSWEPTGVVYYGNAAPALHIYKVGSKLSFSEEATGNLYTTEGFTRINDMYTITTSDHARMDFPFDQIINQDIEVIMEVKSTTGDKSEMIVSINNAEVYHDSNTNGVISFIIPKEMVNDHLTLYFQFPDAIDAGWHLSAFELISLKIDEVN